MQSFTSHIVRTRASQARFLLALLAAGAAFGAFSPWPAAAETAGGANNVVLAQATAGHSSTKAGLQVASVGALTVTSDNVARATSANCTGCRAAAAAIQAVFVTRNASTVTPGNFAVAANSNCTGCDSFAFAYQYVLSTLGPVHLSLAAQQQIAQVRERVRASVASGLPDGELDSRLQALGDEFKAIIDQYLHQAGVSARGAVAERVHTAN